MADNQREPVGIRINRDLLHQARIAAVTSRKTLGQWLEEAIQERIKRELFPVDKITQASSNI